MTDAPEARTPPVRLVRLPTPLVVTTELREFMLSYPLEYGTGAGIGETLRADHAWQVVGDGDTVMGYAWTTMMAGIGMPRGLYLNMAIFPPYQGRGVGIRTLAAVEHEMRGHGVPELYMQVNSTRPETGFRVRRWLLKSGYTLAARDETFGRLYEKCTDEEYVLRCATAVHLRKSL
jgi:N-acetylglutamate synthase-like GNAT family acetyltransferase